jgi:predicted negative regulator of RcsB-dependent stress response
VAIGGVVIAVLLIGAALYTWKKNHDELEANAALFALPSLVGASAKTTEVRAEDFEKIAQEYPNTRVAARVELVAAGILFTDGKYSEAEKQFAKFLSEHEGSSLQSEAALGVAASLEAQGKISEAIPKYQEIISKYSGEHVVPPAKLTLARLLETQNKPEQALKHYDDLIRAPNPYDPWAAEARERRELLLQKFPDLKNTATPSTSMGAPALNLTPSSTSTNKTSAK